MGSGARRVGRLLNWLEGKDFMRSCSDAAKKLSGSRNKSDMVRSTIELTSTTVQSAEVKDFCAKVLRAAAAMLRKQLSVSHSKTDVVRSTL